VPPSVRFALLVGIVVVGCVGACERKPATQPAIRPLLWAVERDGATSYLFGTMHGGADPARIDPVLWSKLAASPTVALEADLAKAASLPVVRTDGTSLRDELGPVYWKKLEDVVGVGTAARLVSLKAVIATVLVAQHGLEDSIAIDNVVESKARERGKQIVYLESLDAQFALLEKWLDVDALQFMLDDPAWIAQQSKHMLEAYNAGDETRIVAVPQRERQRWISSGRSAAHFDAQMEELLYGRNASWIDSIEKLHARGGAFIAVGALHVAGPRSVADLLAQRGYKVTRVTP
jgi:uncharacterized protein